MLKPVMIFAFAALTLACPSSAFAGNCASQLTQQAIRECYARQREWEREHPKPSPSEIAEQYRLTPLPKVPAAAKPGVFKGFYIGMTREAALAAAAAALAPWPAVLRETPNGPGKRNLRVFLSQGPGNVRSLQGCIASNNRLKNDKLSIQDYCVTVGHGEHFVITIDTKTNTVINVAMADFYMRAALGYNLDAAGLNPEDFAGALGKRLGIPFKKIVQEGKKCPRITYGFGVATCAPDEPTTYYMRAIDLKQCKCEIIIFQNLAMNLIGSGSYEVNKNEGAINF